MPTGPEFDLVPSTAAPASSLNGRGYYSPDQRSEGQAGLSPAGVSAQLGVQGALGLGHQLRWDRHGGEHGGALRRGGPGHSFLPVTTPAFSGAGPRVPQVDPSFLFTQLSRHSVPQVPTATVTTLSCHALWGCPVESSVGSKVKCIMNPLDAARAHLQ